MKANLKLIVVFVGALVSSTSGKLDGDAEIEEFAIICAGNGFRFEKHLVKTADGYLLTQFWVPGLIGENKEFDRLKKPILF